MKLILNIIVVCISIGFYFSEAQAGGILLYEYTKDQSTEVQSKAHLLYNDYAKTLQELKIEELRSEYNIGEPDIIKLGKLTSELKTISDELLLIAPEIEYELKFSFSNYTVQGIEKELYKYINYYQIGYFQFSIDADKTPNYYYQNYKLKRRSGQTYGRDYGDIGSEKIQATDFYYIVKITDYRNIAYNYGNNIVFNEKEFSLLEDTEEVNLEKLRSTGYTIDVSEIKEDSMFLIFQKLENGLYINVGHVHQFIHDSLNYDGKLYYLRKTYERNNDGNYLIRTRQIEKVEKVLEKYLDNFSTERRYEIIKKLLLNIEKYNNDEYKESKMRPITSMIQLGVDESIAHDLFKKEFERQSLISGIHRFLNRILRK